MQVKFVSATVGVAWIHYLQIRCGEHTQLEHREVAEAIRDVFKIEFPNISTALEL